MCNRLHFNERTDEIDEKLDAQMNSYTNSIQRKRLNYCEFFRPEMMMTMAPFFIAKMKAHKSGFSLGNVDIIDAHPFCVLSNECKELFVGDKQFELASFLSPNE